MEILGEHSRLTVPIKGGVWTRKQVRNHSVLVQYRREIGKYVHLTKAPISWNWIVHTLRGRRTLHSVRRLNLSLTNIIPLYCSTVSQFEQKNPVPSSNLCISPNTPLHLLGEEISISSDQLVSCTGCLAKQLVALQNIQRAEESRARINNIYIPDCQVYYRD